MNGTESLGRRDAVQLWESVAPGLGNAVANEIRKMGLPKADGCSLEGASSHRGRTASPSEVRRALAQDVSLREDVVQETAVQFWAAVERGRVPADATAGWIFRIAQRAAWRLATARARDFLRSLCPRDERGDALDEVAVPSERHPLEPSRRKALRRAASSLTDEEARLLRAKLEGDGAYAELAAELGVTVGTLRTRACRLVQRLARDVER